MTADYSQIELRLLAHFCGDETLRAAFAEDRDIHAAVAAQIFKVPEAEVTKAAARHGQDGQLRRHLRHERDGARRRGWRSAQGGGGVHRRLLRPLPEGAGVPADAAGEVPARRATSARSWAGGGSFDPTGDQPELAAIAAAGQAEREAINMEIQGSAADLMKRAMLGVHCPAAGAASCRRGCC